MNILGYQMDRAKFIEGIIGVPYKKNAKGPEAFDCWHLTVFVESSMFGRSAPDIEMPEKANWAWMIEQFSTHEELRNWTEIPQPSNGLVHAEDGAVVLMARNKQPAHCGVYFKQERRILHADETDGVMFQDIPTLKANSWARIRFYEPK
jgi:cell wall-associated NlpC family hydrolase